ncbi:DUF4326 domain-containing protein [Ferrimonas marina]|uniref:DUF4326 domain-containing protein n=1 Tax=Ferrimonas marina TaxID=299255 RepID=A0A1M5UDC6_9GAMM|nr:DUF4326 domain-containing protein [Ferrimonas marina]SHH60816.1 protein of unknown function [Ferrimonas marina]
MGSTTLLWYPREFYNVEALHQALRVLADAGQLGESCTICGPKAFSEHLPTNLVSIAFYSSNAREALGACRSAIIVTDNHGRGDQALRHALTMDLPTVQIDTRLMRVAHRNQGKYDRYGGRGTPWGNPHDLVSAGSREEAIRRFRYDWDRDLLQSPDLKARALSELAGKTVACSCRPLDCHLDVIAKHVNRNCPADILPHNIRD